MDKELIRLIVIAILVVVVIIKLVTNVSKNSTSEGNSVGETTHFSYTHNSEQKVIEGVRMAYIYPNKHRIREEKEPEKHRMRKEVVNDLHDTDDVSLEIQIREWVKNAHEVNRILNRIA